VSVFIIIVEDVVCLDESVIPFDVVLIDCTSLDDVMRLFLKFDCL